MERDTLYWVWLAEALGAGSLTLRPLLDRFGSAFDIYRAEPEELRGFGRCERKLNNKDLSRASAICRRCEELGVDVVSMTDDRYPARLRAIQNPPAVLYVRGKLPDLNSLLCVAVVGTRKMSEYGCRATYKISYGLSEAGVVTVSGMALGVDSVTACAAFATGGHTVAVLGSGIDVVYPSANRLIYNELIRSGTVMSEYPPGTRPTQYTFPLRNRIISGISQATFVVEGDENSGAMITARYAVVQGRELFALPGNIGESNSQGTNNMIRDGAHPVSSAADIIREFLPLYGKVVRTDGLVSSNELPDYDRTVLARYGVDPFEAKNGAKKAKIPSERPEGRVSSVKKDAPTRQRTEGDGSDEAYASLEPGLRAVYDRIPEMQVVSVDRLAVEGTSVSEAIAALTLLELRGLVQSLPGGLYSRR